MGQQERLNVTAQVQAILNRAAQRLLTQQQTGETMTVDSKVREPWWPATGQVSITKRKLDWDAIWNTHLEHPLITQRQLAQMFHCHQTTINYILRHYRKQ